jgi:hypothetical protein
MLFVVRLMEVIEYSYLELGLIGVCMVCEE